VFAPGGGGGGAQGCGGGVDLSPWADALHAQFVPQAWVNSYPLPIARQLLDAVPGDGDMLLAPLHAPFSQGDWVVSFSGCSAYFSQAYCNDLFAEHAELAEKAFFQGALAY
jgi:hypothetical protein